ncbi:MAG: efflux RND transporter periplasmic adaptor subunit [Clostridiales bacterium]|nr:efflux RND transporter periplasmic adaptor subunit [Clostridiales bacterium]
MKMKFMHATSAIVAVTASIALASCSGGENQQAMTQQAPAIATQKVTTGNIDFNNTYPATIKGKTDIEIRPQVSGFITKVHVDEGQHVRKGQLLFTIDQVQYQAAVDQAQAAVNSATTALQTAQLTADSKQHLFDRNIISEYENQLAKNSLAQAQAQLATSQAALVSARKNLAYTEVVAPSDGVVGSIPNREGSLASPSMMQPLTTVSDNNEVYAYFSLNEKDMLSLTDNGAVTLNERIKSMPEVTLRLADGTEYPSKGKVATVSGVIDANTGTATVRALFPNPTGMLRSGSTGQILIPATEETVLLIPQRATFEIQDRRFVFVVNDSNKVVSTPITVAPQSDGQVFVVTSGLSDGQTIAVEGVGSTLREGMTIQPVDAAAKAAQAQATQAQ